MLPVIVPPGVLAIVLQPMQPTLLFWIKSYCRNLYSIIKTKFDALSQTSDIGSCKTFNGRKRRQLFDPDAFIGKI